MITDNSRSLERLHFDETDPRVIVAVGGNTLSRGLTLEGLSVSFFVRTASAYDTLLQMGRWFGYRNGYADLTRIWMTDEMREWFHHLATVEQEIRYDIERYESEHVTPEELGARIRTHPKLAITAAAKMQHARGPMLPTRVAGCRRSSSTTETRMAGGQHDGCASARRVAASRRSTRGSPGDHGRRARPERAESSSSSPRTGSTRTAETSTASSSADTSRGASRTANSRSSRSRSWDARATPTTSARSISDWTRRSAASTVLACKVVGGATYADIKTLMSQSDRVIDLDIPVAEIAAMSTGEIARLRNLPENGGKGRRHRAAAALSGVREEQSRCADPRRRASRSTRSSTLSASVSSSPRASLARRRSTT